MRCLHCVNFNLKSYPSHAKVGYGRCMIADIYRQGAVFMSTSADIECDKFKQSKEEIITRRNEWYESGESRRKSKRNR